MLIPLLDGLLCHLPPTWYDGNFTPIVLKYGESPPPQFASLQGHAKLIEPLWIDKKESPSIIAFMESIFRSSRQPLRMA